MNINEKRVFKITLLALCLINLLSFLVYYCVSYHFTNQATLYILFYYFELADTLLPMICATVLYISYSHGGMRVFFPRSLAYSLTWIIYFFPYYAFEYAYGGLEIGSVLTFSLLYTLFEWAIVYATVLLFSLVLISLSRAIAKKRRVARRDLCKIILENQIFNFQKPLTISLFITSVLPFLYKLILEMYDTATFIMDVRYSSGYFTTGEIIYIAFRYVFILVLLLLSHILSYLAKNKLIKIASENL